MATLTVRDLDPDLVRRLRVRAAEHGRSAEAEHRAILRAALVGEGAALGRKEAAERLAAFRARTAGRDAVKAVNLLDESRAQRLCELLGRDDVT
ncbi:MAG: plasmid stabilization protein [Acetobacteraceae bacterium]|nr:plasmid stabilization protein [Acetobacteraceae bacterium]